MNASLIRIWRSATQRVMSLTFLGMLLALAADVLIAARLGAGRTTDALVLALALPLLVDIVTREGTKFSLVPLLMERRAEMEPADQERFISGLLNLSLVAGLVLVGLVVLAARPLATLLGPGLESADRVEVAALLRIAAPLVVFALGISLLGALLNSQKRFVPVALRTAVAPAAVLIAIGLAWDREGLPAWIAAAYPVGFAVYFGGLLVAAGAAGHRQRWTVWPSNADVRLVAAGISLPTLGFVVRRLARLGDRLFASFLAPGSVAAFYFAFRIVSGLQSLIGVSLATTQLPDLVRQDLGGQSAGQARTLRRAVLRSLLLSLPVALALGWLNGPIVRWLYGRGSFDARSIERTSEALLWLAPCLVFAALLPILQSVLYSRRAYGLVFRNMVCVSVANLALAGVMTPLWGLKGLALAATLSSALGVGYTLRLLRVAAVAGRVSAGDGRAEGGP